MTNLAPISETDLHAYVDGQLTPERATEVKAWLAERPDKAAEIATWQRQNEALEALFDPVAGETVPSRLDPHLIAGSRPAARARWPQLAAAALVLLALGGAIGWAGRSFVGPSEREELIAMAVSAHALYVKENRHAVEVAAATDRDHMVAWLSNRVERPINPPDLAEDGFTLIGGRLLPGYEDETGPAAQLMYENAAKERVTVFITAALPGGQKDREFTTRDNLDAFYWGNDKITCTVVGDLPPEQMQSVAKKVYQQLTWRPDGAA